MTILSVIKTLNTMLTQYTLAQAKSHLKRLGKKQGYFYCNIFGWDTYYTLKSTFATPTGKDKNFPRRKLIKV
jgi:hypothetical protein